MFGTSACCILAFRQKLYFSPVQLHFLFASVIFVSSSLFLTLLLFLTAAAALILLLPFLGFYFHQLTE